MGVAQMMALWVFTTCMMIASEVSEEGCTFKVTELIHMVAEMNAKKNYVYHMGKSQVLV